MVPLKRILMVEDESDIRTIAQLALETVGGFAVQMVGSGREACEIAPRFAPDVILLDVMMPGMDGPTTMGKLRQIPETAKTPIIFLTAKAQPYEIAVLKELGAIDVIAKPFDPMTLSDNIRAIWSRNNA